MVILMEAMMDDDESPQSHILDQHCMERNHTAHLIVDQSCIKVEPKILIIGKTSRDVSFLGAPFTAFSSCDLHKENVNMSDIFRLCH